MSWLSDTLGVVVDAGDFLSIEATESLKGRFYQLVGACEDCTRREYLAHSDVIQILAAMADRTTIEVALFSGHAEVLGAAVVPAHTVLRNAAAAWDPERWDLAMCSTDLANGLCVEQVYYDSHGISRPDGVLAMTAWGALDP
jgi:hypothetical protein